MNTSLPDLQTLLDDYSLLLAGILFLVLVDAVLKLIALWQSARRKQIIWFIFLAMINSLGILPAVYLILNRNKTQFKR